MDMYQGHHADGSSIQKHSAGSHYPYVIGKTHGGEQPWYVLSPNSDVVRFTLGDAAVAFAEAAAKLYHLASASIAAAEPETLAERRYRALQSNQVA